MIIIGIVGILDFPRSEDRVWKRLHDAFIEEFPHASFVVEHSTYLPWQGKRIRMFADSIVQKYDTGNEIMLVGYSLGGVVACAIAERFKRSRVLAVVTIGSPNRIKFFYRILSSSAVKLKVPVYTFAGIFDPIVPWFITSYPGGIHTNLVSDHLLYFIFSKKPARQIAKRVRFHQND